MPNKYYEAYTGRNAGHNESERLFTPKFSGQESRRAEEWRGRQHEIDDMVSQCSLFGVVACSMYLNAVV